MAGLEQALAPPPPGVPTDFNRNSDLLPSLIAVSVISLVIMTAAVLVRMYAKVSRSSKFGPEEYLTIFAVLTMIAWTRAAHGEISVLGDVSSYPLLSIRPQRRLPS
ncbi:hypothetical protein EJ04DRAFT_570832 [Polyplosphaeria fusca]|uniref:Uncharacterized protein n=1 Tax=Polyplosphaeria fusca TaxID=682080 RepID=A0A9P4QL51_9PLEO|nr:hypothetical protein EJ04DRAFT_570832 [Polyplosphaeria fusca]